MKPPEKRRSSTKRLEAYAESFKAVNPATGEEIDPVFTDASLEDLDRAAGLAAKDFDAYRRRPLPERAAFLRAVAEEIEELGDPLIERAMLETGLTRERLESERTRTLNQIRLFARVVEEEGWLDVRRNPAEPKRDPVPKPDLRRMMIPVGPVAVFGAGNFPLAFSVAGGDTASALAAGCPVLVKGHPGHPGTSALVGEAITKAVSRCGLPEGTFALLQGKSLLVGTALVRHAQIKAVGFTGSFQAGRALFDLAVAREDPIPFYGEMGSLNPVFVFQGALETRGEALAKEYVESLTLGAGQFCTNPGLLFCADGKPARAFIEAAARHLRDAGPATVVHQRIKTGYDEGIGDRVSIEGVEVVAEGIVDSGPGYHVAPVLLHTDADTFKIHKRLDQEVFGPASIIVTCPSEGEFPEIAESLSGTLAIAVHGTEAELESHAALMTVLERKAGRLVCNGFPTGVEVCTAMHHGGPYPATTDGRATSVGTASIQRFLRPLCFQGFPPALLPEPLRGEG
ncbi:MAG: aldehyde dehydrogenase (NADP(+)) [Planctomycetota bacterium]|jgi:NADP-dependent aldehyde dehydrogenase